MKPESAAYLEKAREFLVKAPAMLTSGWADDAGRAAYLAGFHAAQALIFEKQGRSLKTHSGVQSEFAKLVKDDASFDIQQRRFLARTYNLKALADYETGPGSHVTFEQARAAIDTAGRFVNSILSMIQTNGQTPLPPEGPP